MSLFRKPKKIQRRVFSSNADEEEDGASLDPDAEMEAPPPPIISGKREKEKSRKAIKPQEDNSKPKALLSFADDEDDGEVFQLVVKKSETPEAILNGRAALCAGREDMSDEEDQQSEDGGHDKTRHRFSKPEHLKQMLESGSIPDAAMIHAARKRRQRAREQGAGDYIPIEEPKEPAKLSNRLPCEDVEGDQSDDEERMDMNDITGRKEREERREQFYAVENDSTDGDSDREMNEWENQQIRKGVTAAQLVHSQHETVLSRFMIKPATPGIGTGMDDGDSTAAQSTSTLLEQAYAKNALERTNLAAAVRSSVKAKKEKAKAAALRTPQEILAAIQSRLSELKERSADHSATMARISTELKALKLQQLECQQNAPTAAAKYNFIQK
ncbi:GD19905 [Drosophila simulans]|uniref:GD19905 n=1 Tax=Drosophila simulans TaxID=7240 RepID=B4QYZ1_DROSI|nr:GD19905 [Drosophila simulans]